MALIRRPPVALATPKAVHLHDMLTKIAESDLQLMNDAEKADELDSAEEGEMLLARTKELPPEEAAAELERRGFKGRRQLRRAVDAKKPQKDAPFYLVAAAKRAELRWRDGSGESANPGATGYAIPIPVQARVISTNTAALPEYDPEKDK